MFNRIKQALINTSGKISSGIDNIFFKKKLDDNSLNELEELLVAADMGSAVAALLIQRLKTTKFDKDITVELIKEKLAEEISNILAVSNNKFTCDHPGLNVILVCGVNGSGKTTTIGKLAASYMQSGKKVAIAACDTFRAAAVEQLAEWSIRSNTMLFTGDIEADPASVAYSAMQQAIANNIDILFIDTAGRLHNYQNLMDELSKIVRVLKKIDPIVPHHCLLVIDGTTGQNVFNQVEQFTAIAGVTGLIITKLDGTAKAGAIVGIVKKFALPVHFIGVGEKIDDLKQFDHLDFAKTLVGI
ncbi:Signal recognition particle receptor FtsY [Candidatus Trichorickettsia mobilis]|uniref:Signal recognition particle receptor FtsY n=1 Tax=Candidatus Trichorickettsia mobilis TaxID=1346319 RepID=A0ABZ0UR96_9RICK|nr:signal recognition particle-docking protein FtsY [Candidatus Trichorickettsia mobilis]WPY00163.1 Signal recognition particle receptor FtsY [Candidatus Trichorickettsia mobilis]